MTLAIITLHLIDKMLHREDSLKNLLLTKREVMTDLDLDQMKNQEAEVEIEKAEDRTMIVLDLQVVIEEKAVVTLNTHPEIQETQEIPSPQDKEVQTLDKRDVHIKAVIQEGETSTMEAKSIIKEEKMTATLSLLIGSEKSLIIGKILQEVINQDPIKRQEVGSEMMAADLTLEGVVETTTEVMIQAIEADSEVDSVAVIEEEIEVALEAAEAVSVVAEEASEMKMTMSLRNTLLMKIKPKWLLSNL